MLKAERRTPGRINTREVVDKIESGYLVDNHNGFKTKKSFSPSSLVYGHGACPRYWYLAFHGAEFKEEVTPRQVANMRNGSLSHERIQKAIQDAGIMISTEKKIVHSDPPIFGYRDAEILWDGASVPIEIKTTSEASFDRRKESRTPLPYHVAQLLIYMYIENHDMGGILYENKNTHELLFMPVELDDDYKDWVEKTLDWCRLVKKASDDNLLPHKNYRSNSKVCKTCPVLDVCKQYPIKGDTDIPSLEPLK